MPSRTLARALLVVALAAAGCLAAFGAWAQAVDTAAALAKIGDQGLLGAVCVVCIAGMVWAIRQKGNAEDALRENDRERVAEAKEIGKLTADISRTMATLAAAMEAGNRTAAEGNVFRQTIAQSVESLEKAQDAQGRSTAEALREMRDACNRLMEEVRRSLPRGTP